LAVVPNLYNVCSSISDCGSYGAQVTCLVNLSQGATGCFEIQVYDKNLLPADLSKFGVIQILVTDVGGNIVAIFSEPELIGNYFDAGIEFLTDGLMKCCFTAEMTSNAMTGSLQAEIKMITAPDTGTNEEVIIMRCIRIGSIKASSFSLGFTEGGITPGPGTGGGGGYLIGTTSGTSGSSGFNGTSGTSGILGSNGSSGTSGFGTSGTSGTTGAEGPSGSSGTSGTSGTDGTSGSSGTSGTDGTSGTSGTSAYYDTNYVQLTPPTGIRVNLGSIVPINVVSAPPISTEGNPVYVECCGDAENVDTGSSVRVRLYRDSTPIGTEVELQTSAISTQNNGFSISFIDNPAAGTYTYSFKVTALSGGDYVFGETDGPNILAYEMNGPGTSGTSGTSGESGTSGTSGIDGTSGTSGIDGTSGTSGIDGTSGTSGGDGTSGTSGIGSSGTSGISGIDAAVTLRWELENTSGSNPSGASYFTACCNSGLLNTGSFIFAYTSSTVQSEGFWDTIANAISSGLTPYLQIVQVNNPNVVGLYEITAVSYTDPGNGGQYAVTANGIPAVYASGLWSIGEQYTVSFSLNGQYGTSGTSGTSSTSGTSGENGTSGTSGDGTSGTSGSSGTSGTSGIAGSSGTAGTSGTSGIGSNGTSGTSFASPYTGNLNITSGQAWVSADANGNTTANTTVDWNTGNIQTYTLNAATTTFTFSNGQAGATYILIIRQNASGSQVISWPGTVAWAGAAIPIMTPTASRYDVFTFIFDGSKYFGSYVQNFT
jgi:collagen type VII alpha